MTAGTAEGSDGTGNGAGSEGNGNSTEPPGANPRPQPTGNGAKPPLPIPPPSINLGEQQQTEAGQDMKKPIGSDSGDPDDVEEDEILEESPCKRWSKRREKVKQRDVPGIDAAYLAMDNETGNEVVWNEVLFSERKNFREQEEKIRAVFDHLTRLEHPNLIIFITEYMSSGSMSRFLQRARSSGSLLNIKAWKNWTRQILSALSYLHSCDPPIVHANLTCNTVFIQQNGLVKIGCVAPNTIHHHVKTFRENIKNIHYLAPEYDHLTEATTQADIYSFGVCALEMATTGALQSGSLNGAASTSEKAAERESIGGTPLPSAASSTHMVTEESLRKAVDSIEDLEQKEFIERCLEHDPSKRANVAELLSRLGPPEPDKNDEASLDEDGFIEEARHEETPHEPTPTGGATDQAISPLEPAPNIGPNDGGSQQSTIHHQQTVTVQNPQTTIAQSVAHPHQDGFHTQCTVTTTISTQASATATTSTSAPNAFATNTSTSTLQTPTHPQQQQQQTAPDEGYHTTQSIVEAPTGTTTPLSAELLTANTAIPQYRETRQVVQMQAEILDGQQLRVQLQLDDQMHRQLTALLREEDTAEALASDLVQHGLVSEANSLKMRDILADVLSEHRKRQLEMAARREFGDSSHNQHPLAHSASASSANPSPHQSPKHQSSVPPRGGAASPTMTVATPRSS